MWSSYLQYGDVDLAADEAWSFCCIWVVGVGLGVGGGRGEFFGRGGSVSGVRLCFFRALRAPGGGEGRRKMRRRTGKNLFLNAGISTTPPAIPVVLKGRVGRGWGAVGMC
jgi:hypothetical protein